MEKLWNPSEEHQMLRQMLADFVKNEVEPQAEHFDRVEQFNRPLFQRLGDLGLLGITADTEYGGSAMDATAVVIAHEELSYSDPGFTLAFLAHSLLCVNNIARNASAELQAEFLPKLCSGEWVGAMAMSEPHVGTDVLGMKTTARRDGDHYVLNGRKMWITNGTIDEKSTPCDVVWVYAITGEQQGRPQVSSFIVTKDCPGFSVGQKIRGKLGMRGSNTAELVFEDCRVPARFLVGEEGQSMLHMMRNLEIERVGLAAQSLGIARRCIDVMVRYAREREAFGKPLESFGQIQKYIADSYAEYMACKAYVYATAADLQLDHEGKRIDSDGVKLVATTMGKQVADRAIQVLGGYGYVAEYVVERLWRDAKLLEIGGGTIEAHQKNICKDLSRRNALLP